MSDRDSPQAGAQAATRAVGKLPVDLLRDPLWRALLFMALPATIGFVFNTLYNVVDLIYARSWAGPPGASTQDALGATFPLFFLQLAFGIGLYQGTTALIANAYGRKDSSSVRALTVQALIFGGLVGLAVALVGLSLLDVLLARVQGLHGTEYAWAAGYMVAIYAGGPLIIANFALYALLSGAGNNRAFGVSLTLAFILNIALNYVFMHLLSWGVVGLGIATVLLQGPLNFLYVVWEVRLLGALKGIRWREVRPDTALLRTIAAQALPGSISMLTVAGSVLLINMFASGYADGTLGGISVGARVEQVLLLPIIGVGIGALAIIGQNSGAGQMDRVRRVFWLATWVNLTLTLAATFVLLLFRQPLANWVATPGREADVAAQYLFYAGMAAVFFGLLYSATSFKTGMRQPGFSAWVNVGRQMLLPLLLIPLFQQATPEFVAIPWGSSLATLLAGGFAFAWVARSVQRL